MSGKFDDFLQGQLQDPGIRREYEALQAEHAVNQAMIDARQKSGMTQKEIRNRFSGRHIAMVFQDPMTSLDPTMTIGRQIMESIAVFISRSNQYSILVNLEVFVRVER